MAILNFMPKFAPWYTKDLLKKEDEPATDSSTGFFGDVFNFIAEDFGWTPQPEPQELDWGGAALGAGFGEQATLPEVVDYSGMGDPFGMADPYTEDDWGSNPATPSPFAGPILGGMFGQAPAYTPPPPEPSGLFGAIGGSLGTGEGWGFDLIDEPAQQWAGYNPPPPMPTSYPDISAQWQDTDWVAQPPRESFGGNFGVSFPERLASSQVGADPWADVTNLQGLPPPSADTSQWGTNQIADVPFGGVGGSIGDTFSDFGSSLGSTIAPPPPSQSEWGGFGGNLGASVGALPPLPIPTGPEVGYDMGFAPAAEYPVEGWGQMSPQERGEYVYFSGLVGDDYLTDADYAGMSPDLAQKIGFTDSRIDGGISNGFASIWDKTGSPATKILNTGLNMVGDAVVDPVFDPLDSMGVRISPFQDDFFSEGPSLGFDSSKDINWTAPLEDTVSDIQSANNPWDFVEAQDEEFNDRSMLQQLGLSVLTPGSGIYKNVVGAPKWLRAIDALGDTVQGGQVFDNLGTIPGMSSAFRNVIAPGAVGAGGGALTEAVFDPTFSDQFGNEYNPGYLEMMLGGAGIGIGGRAAIKSGTVPFGAGIDAIDNTGDEIFDALARQSDEIAETPAERLIRLQEEVRASDPDAAAAMFSPGAATPPASMVDEVSTVPPVSALDDAPTSVTPAPTTPLADKVVAHIDLIRTARNADAGTQKAALNKWQEATIREGGSTAGVTLDTFASGAVRLTPIEADAVLKMAIGNAEKMGYSGFSYKEAERAISALRDGTNANPIELTTLRNLLTETPYTPKPTGTIDSVVTPSPTVADGAVAPPPTTVADGVVTPPVTTVPKGVDVNRVEPGMKRPINKTIDEVADLPLTPAEKNTIGADDDFFMEEPMDVVEDEWVDINDWWRDAGNAPVATPARPRRDPIWKKPMEDATRAADDEVIDFTNQADDAVIDFTGSTAKPKDPVIQEIDAWEKQMIARGQDADPEKFQKELDRSLTELVARLGPDAVKPAQFSHDRIPGRIKRLAETAKSDRMALGTREAISDWRKTNTPELDAIKMYANTSWGERWVGGALKNKLADVLTSRGRELSEFLQKQGYSFEESKAITEMELSRYLDERTLREAQNGNPNAMMERALTALHMGDFRPTKEGIEVAEGTGDVAKFVEGARTGNAVLKNLFFGVADVGALMANAIPAVQAQGIPLAVGYLNRLAKLVDIDEAKRLETLSGLAPASAQDILDEKVGTLAGVAGRFLQGTGASKVGDALVKADQVPVALNRLLEKVQFDLVLSRALREPAFEGNVVLLKLLGRDISDPKVLRAASRMANAATSAAPLARGNTRRGIEGASLGSARFLRAQADLILAASKIINPRATAEERIVAATAILSLGATFFAAKAVAGDKMEIDPKNPYSFGQVLLPGGLIMPSLQQRQLAMAFNKSGQELAKVLTDNDGDMSKIIDPWIQFTISRVGPLGQFGLKQFGIGYDPEADKYSYPSRDRSPYGAGMDFKERFANATPIPVGITAWRDNEGPAYGKVLNVAGAGTRPEDEFATALRKEGFNNVDDMKEAWSKEDPVGAAARMAKFYKENPDLFEQDTAIADYQSAKKKNSEKFMSNDYNFTVADWREKRKSLSDGMGGVYNEMGIEEKERPEDDNSFQWIYDYNQTFADALVNTENTAEGMDMEKLGQLQAEFWDEHPEPKVRKAVLEYQIAKADTEADKLWIKSMARLGGIDPETGEPLKSPAGRRTMPNYFEMDRYKWTEISNQDSQDVIARFVQWRDSLPEAAKAGKEREDLLEIFIKSKPDLAYRPDSKEWTPAAIRDVINYGKDSQETGEFTWYKSQMRPELLWFSNDKSWKTIQDAHKKAGRE